jgi:hypothetical protein
MMLTAVIHLVLHAVVPGAVAWFFFRKQWRRAWLIMLATMLVDLDHVFADPIYDPNRCGIGFHPLHTAPAIALYAVLAILPPTRLIGVGLVVHMTLDLVDCGVQRAAPALQLRVMRAGEMGRKLRRGEQQIRGQGRTQSHAPLFKFRP